MNKTTKKVLLLLFVLATSVVKAQTREYYFINSAPANGISVLQNDIRGFQFRNSVKSLKLDSVAINGYSGHQINATGIFLPTATGAPNIPIYCRSLAVPNGATVRVEYHSLNSQTIQNVDLLPSPPILAETDTSLITYEKDSSIYYVNAYYPAQIVSVSDTFSFRGVNTVDISFSPYQYNPVTKDHYLCGAGQSCTAKIK